MDRPYRILSAACTVYIEWDGGIQTGRDGAGKEREWMGAKGGWEGTRGREGGREGRREEGREGWFRERGLGKRTSEEGTERGSGMSAFD